MLIDEYSQVRGWNVHLRVEDKFRTLEKMKIPYSDDAVWLIQGSRVFIVRCDAQFWVLKKRNQD